MGASPAARVHIGRAAAMLAGCLALSACVTGDEAPGDDVGLFKAEVGEISGGVAPGPHSVWYVQRSPTHFVAMGFAAWRAPGPAHGLRAWVSRHFGRGADAPAIAVASRRLNLPVPSLVQVVNVRTGAAVMVRVEEKAHLGDSVIRLGPDVAAALDGDPSRPLLVRLRYMAPVVAYREQPTLRYALLGDRRTEPPTRLAEQGRKPSAPAPPAPLPTPSPAATPAAPGPPLELAKAAPAPPLNLRPELSPQAPAELAFRIQAGAFANLANAEHAVSMLAPAGHATIIPAKRGEATLYRVILEGVRTAAAAETLRARVARIGFRDAEVIRPL